jgi:uncharacterized protein YihD (DUF1040 family)
MLEGIIMTISHVSLADALVRDPLRIPHTLSALASYWKQHPNLSLGKIVEGVGLAFAQDPYNLEDEVFCDHFKMNVVKGKEVTEANPDMLPVLSALEPFWMKNQDFRLGQIVGNVASVKNLPLGEVENADIIDYLRKNEGEWV